MKRIAGVGPGAMCAAIAVVLLPVAAVGGEEQSPGDRFAVAIERGDLAAVKALVDGGNPADTPIEYGPNKVTPLYKASWEGRSDIVRFLISKGANVNFRTADFGETPLGQAAQRGFDDVVEALLKGGADPKAKDRNGYTAFAIALFNGQMDIAEMLLKYVDVNGVDNYGNTHLMAAATTGNTEAMKWLVSKGADVNRVSQLEYGGSTALTSAASVGQADSVRLLLELGANPHLKMKDGGTALSHAIESKNSEVVELIKAALAKTPAPKPKAAGVAGGSATGSATTGTAPPTKPTPKPSPQP